MASLLEEQIRLKKRNAAQLEKEKAEREKTRRSELRLRAKEEEITAKRRGFIIDAWYSQLTAGELKPNELEALKSVLRRHRIKLSKRPDWEKRVKDNWAVLNDIFGEPLKPMPVEVDEENPWQESA